MNYLIGLIPALGWGIMPLLATKAGGSEKNQIFGIGAGASIIGILAFIITKPSVSWQAFIFSMVCGAIWSTAQIGQFISFKRMGVSTTVPLSTVFQLVGNSIIGTLWLGEWQGAKALTIGFGALVIVVIGALLTSVTDKNGEEAGKITVGNVLFLLVTTIGYWVYSVFPNVFNKINFGAHSSEGIFLPEVLGILLGALLYLIFTGELKTFKDKEQYLNIIPGLSWGIAAFAYIFAGRGLGTNTAFVLTQLNVIIATFGGILILHEHKSPREMKYTVAGIICIIVGSILTIFA